MKRILYLAFILLTATGTGWADTWYVGDKVDIAVRTGKGTEYRIIALVQPWDSVEVLEQGEDKWSFVKLANDKEGWIPTRFLTSEKPPRPRLSDLENKHQQLLKDYKALEKENKALKDENGELQENLQQTERSLNQTADSFKKLKNDASEYLSVRKKLETTNTELLNLKNDYNELSEITDRLRNNLMIKGALTGVGILMIGVILGLVLKRRQRRSSLL